MAIPSRETLSEHLGNIPRTTLDYFWAELVLTGIWAPRKLVMQETRSQGTFSALLLLLSFSGWRGQVLWPNHVIPEVHKDAHVWDRQV